MSASAANNDRSDDGVCRETWASLRLQVPANHAANEVPINFLAKAERLSATVFSISSKSEIQSTSLEAHIAWILDRLKAEGIDIPQLVSRGWYADMFCYWLSRSGHGGPVFSHETLRRLADQSIDLGLDIYFAGAD